MKDPIFNINQEILKLIASIDEFKGQWQAFKNLEPYRLNALKKVATIESIGSSTRIEGVKLNDREIEQFLSGLDIYSFKSRDEEEVAGYAQVMNTVFESYDHIPVTENYIKQLHRILLQYSTKDARHRGEYKKLPNNVEAFDHNGKSIGVIFQTTTPFDTPAKMKALLEWTGHHLKTNEIHPLLTISFFVVSFLAIHPFQDGNGRLSRVLTTLLLLQQGYAYVPYSSLEHVIEMNKDNYYLALRKAQNTLETDFNGLNSWILFFLNALKTQKDLLHKKLEREKLTINLPKLSTQILEVVKEQGKSTISDIHAITGANRNTIKKNLRELVQRRYLEQHGKGRGTWYSMGERP